MNSRAPTDGSSDTANPGPTSTAEKNPTSRPEDKAENDTTPGLGGATPRSLTIANSASGSSVIAGNRNSGTRASVISLDTPLSPRSHSNTAQGLGGAAEGNTISGPGGIVEGDTTPRSPAEGWPFGSGTSAGNRDSGIRSSVASSPMLGPPTPYSNITMVLGGAAESDTTAAPGGMAEKNTVSGLAGTATAGN